MYLLSPGLISSLFSLRSLFYLFNEGGRGEFTIGVNFLVKHNVQCTTEYTRRNLPEWAHHTFLLACHELS